ncbi:MAG: M23 family metallopeptidase [Acidimicrobiia bacterium]
MTRRMALIAWVGVVALGYSLLAAVPASADVTADEVAAARDALREVQSRLEDEVGRYDDVVAEEALLRDRLDRLLVGLAARERELLLARRSARDRAAEMYMTAGASSSTVLTADVASAPARYVYLESVSQTDRDLVNRLETSRRDYEQQKTLVDDAVAEQALLRGEMEALLDQVYSELEEANAEYQAVKDEWDAQEAERIRREEEEQRRLEFLATSTTLPPAPTTTAGIGTTQPGATSTTPVVTTTTLPPAPTTTVPPQPPGTRVCPVDGATSFTDSWGAPRPGGRSHAGTDMLAAQGTPLVAIEGGYIWSPNWHSAGGLGLYIRGDSGDRWYYAHLNAYVTGLVDGLRVEAGQRVGFVGQTGNASTPHLHLGWQPGGGAYQNPYSVVKGLCG